MLEWSLWTTAALLLIVSFFSLNLATQSFCHCSQRHSNLELRFLCVLPLKFLYIPFPHRENLIETGCELHSSCSKWGPGASIIHIPYRLVRNVVFGPESVCKWGLQQFMCLFQRLSPRCQQCSSITFSASISMVEFFKELGHASLT